VLQLSDKKRTLAPSLSGGMKRKLSLGIAMIGDTKILILDEPTSGMESRSATSCLGSSSGSCALKELSY